MAGVCSLDALQVQYLKLVDSGLQTDGCGPAFTAALKVKTKGFIERRTRPVLLLQTLSPNPKKEQQGSG